MNTKISLQKILAVLVGGVIGAVIGNIVYASLIDQMWKPFVVALFFLILSVSVFLTLWIVSKALGDFDYFISNPINKDIFRFLFPVALIGIFGFSMLFEFLYELGGDFNTPEPTSYIFALDISGSMDDTDPNGQEAEAVSKIIDQMDDDFPFAVYTFSDNVECVEKMHYKTEEDSEKNWEFDYYGMTSMYGVIDRILDDYNNGRNNSNWVGGDAPRIILVSDGYPTDGDFFGRSSYDAAKSCRESRISICGISVAGADQELMKKLSENTGGRSFSINNIDNLYDSLNSALTAKSSGDRTLISYRGFVDNDTFYCVLRIIFIALIAWLYSFVIYFANALYLDWNIILIVKIITAIASGLFVEFSIQSYLGNELISRIVMCILISASILHTIIHEKNNFKQINTNKTDNERKVSDIKSLDSDKADIKILK